MTRHPLQLTYGPDPIFRKKATAVAEVDDGVRETVEAMFDLLYREKGVGIGANMAGLLQRIVVIDLQEGGARQPLALINPEIIWSGEETQTFTEASLSFPGISAEITRPKSIKVRYLDCEGCAQELEAEGWLAQVIQHEVDYLDGKTYLDHLSATKRNMLMRKYKKNRG